MPYFTLPHLPSLQHTIVNCNLPHCTAPYYAIVFYDKRHRATLFYNIHDAQLRYIIPYAVLHSFFALFIFYTVFPQFRHRYTFLHRPISISYHPTLLYFRFLSLLSDRRKRRMAQTQEQRDAVKAKTTSGNDMS